MESEGKITILVLVGFLLMTCVILIVIIVTNISRKRQLIRESKIQALEYEKRELEHRQQIDYFRIVNEAEEKEREKLAKDLHDGVLPILSTSYRSLDKNVMDYGGNSFDIARMEKDVQIFGDAITTLRNVSHNLVPPYLISKGLIKALSQFIEQIDGAGEAQAMIINETDFDNDLPFSMPEQLNIYRILLELLNNLTKHSGFGFLTLIILKEHKSILFDIIHNGRAVTNEEINLLAQNSKGLGLKSIQSRVLLLNARLDYISQGETARIKLDVPIKDKLYL